MITILDFILKLVIVCFCCFFSPLLSSRLIWEAERQKYEFARELHKKHDKIRQVRFFILFFTHISLYPGLDV